MSEFSGVQTGANRETVYENASALQQSSGFLDAEEANRQAGLQAFYVKMIANWCNSTSTTSTMSAESEINLPINLIITSSVLDSWQSQLQTKGYIVTRNGQWFTIAVPPPGP